MNTTQKKVVTFGEIMLRLATPGYQRFIQSSHLSATFGGGEANVAVSLANYGIPTEFVTRLPQNDLAEWCLSDLRKYNVGIRHILRGGNRMGIYFLETGAVARPSKVVYDRAGSAISEIITVSCDLNYRKNLWKYGKKASEIMPSLVDGCDIILGNEEDAEKVFGIKPEGFQAEHTDGKLEASEFESVCKQLMEKFPRARKVIITLRGSINANHNTWGGCLYSDKLYQSNRYDITHIVDRVGGGDSFMGGLIYGLITHPQDDQQALDFAVAASCLKHTVYGDFNLVSVSEVENLMKGDGSGRVVR